MRLSNCLGSCNRYLKWHSAKAVSYKASQKLGNLTDYRVIGSSAIVPVTIYCEAIEECLPNDGLYYVLYYNNNKNKNNNNITKTTSSHVPRRCSTLTQTTIIIIVIAEFCI